MKVVEVLKNDTNVMETHIFGDICVPQALADYTFPAFSGYFMTIRLDEYAFKGVSEGYLYIFLDLLGYYSEDYGEYSMVPMAFYSKDEPTEIFDDFNEENAPEFKEMKKMYMLEDGKGIEIDKDTITITDKAILDFFLNFDDDIKEVRFVFNHDLKENSFNEGVFKIIK